MICKKCNHLASKHDTFLGCSQIDADGYICSCVLQEEEIEAYNEKLEYKAIAETARLYYRGAATADDLGKALGMK